jgi:hypothetical protein
VDRVRRWGTGWRAAVCLIAFASGCAADEGDGGSAGRGGRSGSGSGGDDFGNSTGAKGGSGGAGGAGSPGFGTPTDGGPSASDASFVPPGAGCDKVDFLFVIDNSSSMEDQQAALIASFPGFIATIQGTLQADSDYHIMVVDTDAATHCQTDCASVPAARCMDPAGGYACTATYDACDTTLGAGVVEPTGEYASNQLCSVAGGKRYIVEGEPDLPMTFGCVAQVGTTGDNAEKPMDAMVAALSDALNGAGGCNEGFLRDDAILVVTFISDDPKNEDTGTPQTWYDAVLAAKNGDPQSVVVIGITPYWPGCREDRPTDIRGMHWAEFVMKWPRSVHGNVCEFDYTGLFAAAIAEIDGACDTFVPPI